MGKGRLQIHTYCVTQVSLNFIWKSGDKPNMLKKNASRKYVNGQLLSADCGTKLGQLGRQHVGTVVHSMARNTNNECMTK